MDKKETVYQFICDYKLTHDGNSPSIREIGRACSISCSSLVSYYLGQLIDRGKIEIFDDSRKIKVIGGAWKVDLELLDLNQNRDMINTAQLKSGPGRC